MLSLVKPDESFRDEWGNLIKDWDNSRKRPRIFFQENFETFLKLVQELSM